MPARSAGRAMRRRAKLRCCQKRVALAHAGARLRLRLRRHATACCFTGIEGVGLGSQRKSV